MVVRILTVFLVVCFSSFAVPSEKPKAICHITVVFEDIHGNSTFKEYFPKVNSPKACEERAESHRTNFAPHQVKKKEVTAKWEKTP